MTNRDWVHTAISHRETEAVPYCFDFTPPARRKVEAHYGSPAEDALALPIRMAGPKSIKPLYAPPAEFGAQATDEFGVVWSTSDDDRGVPLRPRLPEPDLAGYAFPAPAAPYRFEDLAAWCRENRERYTVVWVGDLWERATFLRGMEGILTDLALHPGFVDALLDGIADYVLATMRILFDRLAFDCVAVSDDYGAQQAMVMSPAHWRRFVRPRLARIYALAKAHGRHVLHHSDGNIEPILGDLVDLGCDILHPVQPESMDVFRLKREYGRHLAFFGGVRTQDLLVSASPREVRAAVAALKREMSRGGGYVVSNGITLQGDVPLENLVALIEEARA